VAIHFNQQEDMMIFEIRNYHFNPALFKPYKQWVKSKAIQYLSSKLDILGFWFNTSDEPEVLGQPLDDLGSANVTWIIRWNDMEHRNSVLPVVLSSPEWESIFSKVPGGEESYLRVECKFAESLFS
jgi:hypothetical protein